MIDNKLCPVATSAFVQDPRRMGSFQGKAAAATSRPPVLDESLHRDAFEQMADLCLWVDPVNGHVVGGNKALRQSLAYPLREIIGRPVQQLAEAGSLAQSAAAWQAIASGARLADADTTTRRNAAALAPILRGLLAAERVDPAVQVAAALALVVSGADDDEAGLSLIRLIVRTPEEGYLRMELLRQAGRLGPLAHRLADELRLLSDDPTIGAEARDVLARIDGATAR